MGEDLGKRIKGNEEKRGAEETRMEEKEMKEEPRKRKGTEGKEIRR